jgi:glucose/arabinose dehydrogenase
MLPSWVAVPRLRHLALLVALLAAGAVLSACGSGDGGGTADAAQRGPAVKLERVGTFAQPVGLTAPPGDARRLYVVEQTGRIRVVRDGRTLPTPFLDVSRLITAGGEQGLLGLAFPPDHAESRRFYVHYSDRGGDNRVVEYRAPDPDRADPGSARLVLTAPGLEPNHNGGQLAFGPDGLLYIGLGDGGGGNDPHGPRGNAQRLDVLLGKVLRIDPRADGDRPYRIPSSNPFAGRRGARGEVYAYGLRNPWRFTFDRATGDLAIGDVGQDAIEEVDFVRRGRGRGANFGWRVLEGRRRLTREPLRGRVVGPVLQLRHERGFCSVTGGVIVRDPALPALRGRYVYGDFCDGRVRSAVLRPRGTRDLGALPLPQVGSISTFGEDARGRVHVASLDGSVLRLTAR